MARAPAAAGAAAAGATAAAPESVPSATRSMDFAARPERLQKLGTGHGQREFSYVAHTEFERPHPCPNEVIRTRYDSLANLIAMGGAAQPRTGPAPNPFPHAPLALCAPDPPG